MLSRGLRRRKACRSPLGGSVQQADGLGRKLPRVRCDPAHVEAGRRMNGESCLPEMAKSGKASVATVNKSSRWDWEVSHLGAFVHPRRFGGRLLIMDRRRILLAWDKSSPVTTSSSPPSVLSSSNDPAWAPTAMCAPGRPRPRRCALSLLRLRALWLTRRLSEAEWQAELVHQINYPLDTWIRGIKYRCIACGGFPVRLRLSAGSNVSSA